MPGAPDREGALGVDVLVVSGATSRRCQPVGLVAGRD